MINVLFIDNFDSFVFNLVDEFEKRNCVVQTYRNSVPMKQIKAIVSSFKPELIAISPGPSNPANAGNSMPIIKEYSGKIPIFGVCLGHQCIAEAFGGIVKRAPETIHGKPSKVFHDEKTIFNGISNPFQVGRYHSLCATKIPKGLEISAKTENGIIMGLRHKKFNKCFVEGVQFHPESILTPEGPKIIENVLQMIRDL